MRNNLIRLALYYLGLSSMFMVLALTYNSKKLKTVQKVLEQDEKRNNNKRLEDLYRGL